jgi:MHS family alpha-ketoglutarate permease-like MFS transporter
VTVPAAVSATAAGRLKAIFGGSAGNLVEWYDWFAYASFAIYFARHFFPNGDTTAQLLQTAAVFAIGFVARPFGAGLMGLYADRAGRRAALTASVALMSLGSFAIAVIPDFGRIGVAAPVLLTVIRLVQGLSLGGEYGASATYMSEMAGRRHRGFWSSFQHMTLLMGQLLALAVLIVLQHALPQAALEAWGWRIPFALGGVLAIVVFWMRTGIEESGAYQAARAAGAPRATIGRLLREHPRETAQVFMISGGGSIAFYAYTTYMQKFLTNTAGYPKDVAATISAASLMILVVLLPLFGWVSDKLSRKTNLAFTFTAGALLTFPIMSTIARSHDVGLAFALVATLAVIQTAYSSVAAVVKSELYPAHVRALGVALPYATANALFGGTAEYVALWFKQAGHESGFYIYVSLVMAAALAATLSLPNTNVTSLILED